MTTEPNATVAVEQIEDDLLWLRYQVLSLCEHTEDDPQLCKVASEDHEGKQGAYARGRINEAKGIRRAIAEVVRERLANRLAASNPVREQQSEEGIARIIIGPRERVADGVKFTIEQLRDIRWSQASEAERKDALWAAKAILAALAPAPQTVAVAYRHTMHMEFGQTRIRLSESQENPFGLPGRDYGEEYRVTCEPLFLSPQPAPPSTEQFAENANCSPPPEVEVGPEVAR